MKYVEVVAHAESAETVSAIAEKHEIADFRLGVVGKDKMQPMRLLVTEDKLQSVLDALQALFGKQPAARIVVLPVEISLPKPSEEEREEEDAATTARERLYEEVEKNARLDLNFVVLIILSTIVAAIGIIENNVAVVIGAMVIAPLLGPNLAFGLGTALGDIPLMRKSALSNSVGIVLAIALSVLLGIFWPFADKSPELLARTRVGLDSVALALASGAAAALSLTTGLSSILVGVMVAVALLPPAVTLGLMLGHGDLGLATGAGLLLAINLVCVNLASKVVFFLKDIRPRTWWEKKKAKRAMVIYILAWLATLIILVFFIYGRRAYAT
ncbi:TIGR00341 family protein [Thiovibrio frasassiensis]|uniref:TIGR00341 family protein n=1 Tax=Thiovibrio frasassiensis TaxID=2984131 RepID=A0A9X4RLI5_9BACT|nr:TIGR00341 family protein [Thiovibrio frasassiensis]MDG4475178.1 TIGR00341 family protein [Thiovibrio frasassiensis]